MSQPTKAPYFIELLTRDGHLKSRHRFEKLPINIGRGYGNDLILDDPYVAANHAVIELAESGEIHIRDLGSQNGLVSDSKQQSEIMLDNNIIRLGHTNIRVRDAEFNVVKELADTVSHRWEGWPPAIAGLVMIAISALVTVWLNEFEKFSIISYISAISLIFGMVLMWCGGWAFVTRMIGGGSARFGRHIFIVACAILLFDLWDVLSITLAYAFSLEFLTRYGSHITMAIAAGMVFFHLNTINGQHKKQFIAMCISLSLLGSGLILMNNYQRSGNLSDELYMTHLLPPVFRISGNQSTEAFITESNTLKAVLDKERLEPANTSRGLLGN